MSRLEQLQREFLSALHLPLRGASRRAAELPPSDEPHASDFLETAERIIKPSPNLSSAERLELYHRQYWYRLLDSIAEDFPLLNRIMGPERFWGLMEDYLLACPSTSFTLRHLGSRLPGFLETWTGASLLERVWFHSIARLEYARMEVFERAEYRPVLPEEMAMQVLVLQPHVVRLGLPAPADECEEWEGFEATEIPLTPIHLAVWRSAERVPALARITAVESLLLDRLAAGGTLESIFAEPLEPEPTQDEVAHWFAAWQARGWIAVKPGEDATIEFLRPPEVESSSNGVDKMGSQARLLD
jgi:hypothetical protein